jgi:hypothetical protein
VRTRLAFVLIAAVSVVALAASLASGAPRVQQRRTAGPETASECFTQLRTLVARVASLDRVLDRVKAGDVYLDYNPQTKTFYPVEKDTVFVLGAALSAIQGPGYVVTEKALEALTKKSLAKLTAAAELGHQLVQAREKRCNDLKSGGAAGGATAGSATFTLVSDETVVSNVDQQNLTKVDASAGKAHVQAGLVVWDETWTLPETITPGKPSSIMLGLNVTNNGPKPGPGQYDVGLGVTAPNLSEQLTLDISSALQGNKTYTWAVTADSTTQDLVVVIHPYQSSSITYHYRRGG